MKDLTIVIPVRDEEPKTVSKLKARLESKGAEVIIVDDGSKIPHPNAIKLGFNAGYGGAILTGIRNSTRPLILTMDGDGQHEAKYAEHLYTAWKMMDEVDMLIGVRRLQHEVWFRYLGRKFLNGVASLIAAYWLPDLNSGMRIFKKHIAEGYTPILCKQFSFTTSLTMSMILDGYRLEWFPIRVRERKHGQSRVKVIRHGLITLWYILKLGFALRTRAIRSLWRKFCGKEAIVHS